MDVNTYRRRRMEWLNAEPVYRRLCATCLQPDFSCYCACLRPFDPRIRFVILSHPIEVHRRIATGRMSHLCLIGSELLMGHDFTEHVRMNEILADPQLHCVMLYPGPGSRSLSHMSVGEKFELVPSGKTLAVLVIDGTWATAKKMVNRSRNLNRLPRVCFTPPGPSRFRVRRQPRPECYSTIEAIHHTIDLLGEGGRAHDILLEIFDKMVNRQLELAHCARRPTTGILP